MIGQQLLQHIVYFTLAYLSLTVNMTLDWSVGRIVLDWHWLDVPDRVLFKLAVTVHQCLNGRAPPYLSEHCIPVSSDDTRRHLRDPTSSTDCFRRLLKTYLFAQY